jgi:PAS domain S-box-containing protein
MLSADPRSADPDSPFGLSAFPPDVAAVLRAKMALSLPEAEHFRELADALHDAVALTDASGTRMLYISAAYEEIWGRPRAELYVDGLALLNGVHPEDRDRVRDAILRPPPDEHDLEFRVLRGPGDQRWVWRRCFPVRNTAGGVVRLASIIEDVTDRKRIVESHERLIRGFTHDVKNPLGAAAGFLALLEERVGGDLTDAQSMYVTRARHSIAVAIRLVSQLLDIERAESGQLTLHLDDVDVFALSREIIDTFRPAASARSQTITWLPADDDGLLVASDGDRVRQILANLVSNATKYANRGGQILVRAWRAAADAPRPGRWVAVAVEDDGPGIPFEKQNMLFREFTRFQPDAAAGTGIGLAISQRLAHALGGMITFRSTPGGGSSFTVWLPAAA